MARAALNNKGVAMSEPSKQLLGVLCINQCGKDGEPVRDLLGVLCINQC